MERWTVAVLAVQRTPELSTKGDLRAVYLNCPACHLSIRVRPEQLLPAHCPRCSARRGHAVPLFSSPLPYGRLAAPDAHGPSSDAAA